MKRAEPERYLCYVTVYNDGLMVLVELPNHQLFDFQLMEVGIIKQLAITSMNPHIANSSDGQSYCHQLCSNRGKASLVTRLNHYNRQIRINGQ